jgi:hypothetical protein
MIMPVNKIAWGIVKYKTLLNIVLYASNGVSKVTSKTANQVNTMASDEEVSIPNPYNFMKYCCF